MANYEPFTYCCGAAEVGNLHGTARQVERDIQTFIENYQGDVADGAPEEIPAMFIATTVPSQRSAVTALRRLKFREVLTSTNPGTGNKVTLWAKKLTYKK